MSKYHTFAIAVATLILGFGIGYVFAGAPAQPADTHVMPDGTVMSNDGSNMEQMMHDMNAALRGKTGDDFDRAFLEEMIVHHEGAVSMAELALGSASHKEIKDLATAIISAQNVEIASMKSWLAQWYE